MSINRTAATPGTTGLLPVLRPRIGALEGFAIRFAGWRDRVRCRSVSDGSATHWVHELQARVQARETDLVRVVDAVAARIDRELAEVDVVLTRPDPNVLVPLAVHAATAVAPRARHADAVARRAARGLQAEQQSALQRNHREREAASVRHAVLVAERTALLGALANVRETARETFDVRAARYTRARTGWLGLPPQREHDLPNYIAAAGPAGLRVAPSVNTSVTVPTPPAPPSASEEEHR